MKSLRRKKDFNFKRVLSAVGVVIFLVCSYVFYDSVRSESEILDTILSSSRNQKEFLIQMKEMTESQEILRGYPFFTAFHKSKAFPNDLSPSCMFEKNVEEMALFKTENWPEAEINFEAVNFSWMKEILHDNVLNAKWKSSLRDYDVPELHDLKGCSTVKWAKARFLDSLRKQDTQEAFQEVRHLAELLFSYGLDTVARKILIAETVFATAHPSSVSPDWKVIPLEVLERTKKYFGGMEYLADPRLPDEMLPLWASLKIGRCRTLGRGLELYSYLRAKHLTKYARKIAAFNQLMQESGAECLSSQEVEAWRQLKKEPWFENSYCSSFPLRDPVAQLGLDWKVLSWLPFVHTAIKKCEIQLKISEVYFG